MSGSEQRGVDYRKRAMAALRSRLASYLRPLLGPRADLGPDTSVEARLHYLLDEVSELRMIVRELSTTSSVRQTDRKQTESSFSYQWAELSEGRHLPGDPRFEAEMLDLLCRYSDLRPAWFKGRSVLDVGCGSGRWSYALCKLGAHVTAIDQSVEGVEHTERLLAGAPHFTARRADLLQPLPVKREFDLVWCYGVAHHTGDTRRAVGNAAAAVRPGGRLFLMIYGEPAHAEDFVEINTYVGIRRATQLMTFDEKRTYLEGRFPKQHVHGYFDATSPAINDLHRFEEIARWLRDLGYRDIRRTLPSRNHHIVADLPQQALR